MSACIELSKRHFSTPMQLRYNYSNSYELLVFVQLLCESCFLMVHLSSLRCGFLSHYVRYCKISLQGLFFLSSKTMPVLFFFLSFSAPKNDSASFPRLFLSSNSFSESRFFLACCLFLSAFQLTCSDLSLPFVYFV